MLRFTIRDVLWLMVIVGLAVGWWVDHSRHADTARRLDAVEHMLQATLDQYSKELGRSVLIKDEDISYRGKVP